jgi:hypothetical protein
MKKLFSLILVTALVAAPVLAATKTDQVPVKGQTITLSVAVNGVNVKSIAFTLPNFTVPYTYTIPDAPTPDPLPIPVPVSGNFFSPNSFWNTKLLDSASLAPNSAALVSEFVKNTQPTDRGGVVPFGFPNIIMVDPVYVVDASTPKVPVKLVGEDGRESPYTNLAKDLAALGGVRVPANFQVSLGTDWSAVIYDKSTDTMVEGWRWRKYGTGWAFSWGAVIKNASTHPGVIARGINSDGGYEGQGARASGLALAGGTATSAEIASGVIPHKIAVAIYRASNEYKAPATRTDGDRIGAEYIKEGQIFRFPKNITINPAWSAATKALVIAIRDYGLIVSDTSGSLSLTVRDERQLAPAPPTTLPAVWDDDIEARRSITTSEWPEYWAWSRYTAHFPKHTTNHQNGQWKIGDPKQCWLWMGIENEIPWSQLQAVA